MHKEILDIIRQIPRGKVSSYGAVARAAGYPRGARMVARALHGSFDVPWQRVLGAGGEIKLRGESAFEQRFRLQSEGVIFRGRRVDMKRYEFKFPKKSASKSSKSANPVYIWVSRMGLMAFLWARVTLSVPTLAIILVAAARFQMVRPAQILSALMGSFRAVGIMALTVGLVHLVLTHGWRFDNQIIGPSFESLIGMGAYILALGHDRNFMLEILSRLVGRRKP